VEARIPAGVLGGVVKREASIQAGLFSVTGEPSRLLIDMEIFWGLFSGGHRSVQIIPEEDFSMLTGGALSPLPTWPQAY